MARTPELEQALLHGKTEEEQLILKVNWTMADLREYYVKRNSKRQYVVNQMWRILDLLNPGEVKACHQFSPIKT